MDFLTTNFIVTLVIGGGVGWLASILMRTDAQMGMLANVIVGIGGSFLGVAGVKALGVWPNVSLGGWLVSILGAALLIAILRGLGVFSRVTAQR